MQLTVINEQGSKASTIDVTDTLVKTEVNKNALYEAIKNELANRRHGTSKTKSRDEVSGGGRKPFRQKGTGRARAGSTRSPLWVGGGHVHAIRPRDYHYTLPKQIKRLALLSVFSMKHGENNLTIVEDISIDKPQTKRMATFIKKVKKEGSRSVAFIVGKTDDEKTYKNLVLSLRNIGKLSLANADALAIHPLYYADEIIVTKSAMTKLSDRVKTIAKAG